MRRVIVPVTAAALAVSASVAFAATSQTMNGTVKRYDQKAMTLTLDSGTTFHLAKSWKNPGVKTGEKVAVVYTDKNGRHTASAVTIRK